MKGDVKYDANMIVFFCSNSETKKSHPFFTHNGNEAYGYATYGIRARVEKFGPNWAQTTPTPFVLELHVY